MKGIYVFLAQGYEPLEALAPMDILRRAKLDCKFVAVGSVEVLLPSTQGYGIQADMTFDEFIEEADLSGNEGCMIFPGGLPGADNLGECGALVEIMKNHFNAGGLTCAICAAPARMLAANLQTALKGRKLTVYEGFEKELTQYGIECTGADVQEDGNLITAKGPGLAIDFGLAILNRLVDHRIYDVVKNAMML